MHRRELLTSSIASAGALISGRAWSTPSSDQRLLVVFLRGGYDAVNVVIPTYSDFYYESRPTISIARPDANNPDAALPLDGEWSLHPTLEKSILPLWKKGQVAFIPFAGTDDMTRSHFETQDTIELGLPSKAPRDYQSGFMARLAAELSRPRPISFTGHPPLTFRSSSAVPNIPIARVRQPAIDERQTELIRDMYKGQDLKSSVDEGFNARDKAWTVVGAEMAAASRGAPPARGFELTARRVARLMKMDYNLAFLDVGGWDTHVGQGGARGPLANQVDQLGRGIAALADELGPLAWAQTTVVVVSEFGRTFRENGDRGTDHGHGSVYWLLGGSIKGGQIVGDQVKLDRENLNELRDLRVLSDYRSIFSNLLQQKFGVSKTSIAKIFPDFSPLNLSLV